MTLKKQMIMFITALLIILLIGTFWLNFLNTKTFLENQLSSHAQDTATSLGLSLSFVANPEEPATMKTMINAIFDRGFYSYIKLTDLENNIIYQRHNTQNIEGIPSWFINSVPINAPVAESFVQSGWMPIGSLHVQSHPGYAHMQLWQTTTILLSWFLIAMILSILIAHIALKAMLKPLKDMEKQADAIVKKQYILQEKLPRTIEFRQVVSAMNAMVKKMKDVFERDAKMATKLQKMAYQDSVTKMSNRQHFEMLADSLLDPKQEASEGVLCLIRVEGLKDLNDKFGYLIGDKTICSLADNLRQQLTSEKAIYARLNGTEIIAVLPSMSAAQIHDKACTIANYFPKILDHLNAQETTTYVSIAVMHYQPGESRGALLGKLDHAIKQAKNLGKNQTYFYETKVDKTSENLEWKKIINDALSEKRFTLFQQSSYTEDNNIHHKELLVRMKEPDGTLKSAGYFMPAVQQLDKTFEIDQLVIEQAINYLKKSNTNNLIAVNLSQAMLCQEESFNWLLNRTKDLSNKNLAFELPEPLARSKKSQIWPLVKQLKSLGIQVGIDHFGSQLGDMQYLQDLLPNYIKLDSSFSKAMDKDEHTRSYIASLCEMASSLDITVIAMAVENETQKQAFKTLGIKHYQGYYFNAPTPLEELLNN